MALRSTIHKAQLSVADLDRGYYADHALTLARHPSETEERLMVRVLAFALHADPALGFGRGLSSEDEPDLAISDDTGQLQLWIAVGLPDEKWLRKAAARAPRVVLLMVAVVRHLREDLSGKGSIPSRIKAFNKTLLPHCLITFK